MKKILSILICLVLGISSAWATQYTHTVKVYARNGNVSTAGGGTVEAQGGWAGQYLASDWEWGTTATYKQGPSTDVSISTTESSGSLGIKKASAKKKTAKTNAATEKLKAARRAMNLDR